MPYKDPGKHKESMRLGQKVFRDKVRAALLAALGNKCLHCGISDTRVLQIDHVNGGGRAERRRCSYPMLWKKMLDSVLAGEERYQLLCANCNWIKRVEKNEVPKPYRAGH